MYAIIGLGNPGSEYDGTRHNLGFRVIDVLCEKFELRLVAGKGEYLIGKCSHRGEQMYLVKPLTYMNNSGIAVSDIVKRYPISLQNILVICDDFQLLLGRLRLRPKGSDGGHNGLYSIIYQLGSENFPRLRCGIATDGMPKKKLGMAQFVLSPFNSDEKPVVKEMVGRGLNAVLTFLVEGIEAAMNKFNNTTVLKMEKQ